MNIDDEFSAYKAATLPRVTTPGADEISRTVYRRQRRRLAMTGAFATVAVGALGVQILTAPSGTISFAPPTPSPSPISSASPSPSPSGSASGSASPSPTPAGTRSFPSKVDLVATGPAQAILKPVGGRYEGVMTATFHNNGAGTYTFGVVRVTLPAGASFDFQGIRTDEWGMDACLLQADQMWECGAQPAVVPARGGQATVKFRIVVAIAPQAEVITLQGGRIQPVAFTYDGDRKEVPDAVPADNVHKFTLVLNPS